MKRKDAAVLKVLAECGLGEDENLDPNLDRVLEDAVDHVNDPELSFLDDVEALFTKKDNPKI